MGRTRLAPLALVLGTFLAVQGSPAPARADVAPLGLDRLSASAEDGMLWVDYRLSHGSWRWVRKGAVALTLHVRLDGTGEAWDVPLATVAGRLGFEADELARARQVTVRIDGVGRRGAVRGMVLGGNAYDALTFPLGPTAPPPRLDPQPRFDPPPEPAAPPRPATGDVVAACGRATIGASSLEACIAATAGVRFDPIPVIAACSRATVGQDSLNDCLRRISHARFEPVRAIQACSRATVGNDAVLDCIGAAARARQDPSDTIAACAKASVGNQALLSCLSAAFGAAHPR